MPNELTNPFNQIIIGFTLVLIGVIWVCYNMDKKGIIKTNKVKTIKKVIIEPVWVDYMPDFYEQGKVYISEKYKTSKHLCLCGCGRMTIMPIDDGTKWWQLVKENDGTVSFIGSVGNYQFDCKSHYIITKNIANFI